MITRGMSTNTLITRGYGHLTVIVELVTSSLQFIRETTIKSFIRDATTKLFKRG